MKKPANRIFNARNILFIIVCFLILLRNLIWVLPTATMNAIMEDLNISLSKAGMMIFVCNVVMGIFLFIGSYLIDRFGAIKTLILSMVLFSFDGIFSTISNNFYIIMIGRLLSGISIGLSTSATVAIITIWVNKDHYRIANGVNSAFNSISLTIAYGILLPISIKLGSWKNTIMLLSILALLNGVLLSVWSFGREDKTIKPKSERRANNSLARAIKYKEVQHLTVATGCLVWIFSSYFTYLPLFFTGVRNFSTDYANILTGLMSSAGVIGSFTIGYGLKYFKNVKDLLFLLIIGMLAGTLGTVLISNVLALNLFVILIGLSFMSYGVVQVTMIMGLEGITPNVATAAVTIVSSMGSILSIFIPSLFGYLELRFGIQGAFIILNVFPIIALFSIFHLPISEARIRSKKTQKDVF